MTNEIKAPQPALPPLPPTRHRFEVAINSLGERMDYTEADMRAYATQAVAEALAAIQAPEGAELPPLRAWCGCCGSRQPASFRPAEDAKTGEPYEDLCCDKCHYVIATVSGRASISAAQSPAEGDALREMEARKDAAYEERNRCVALIARMAVAMGLPVAVTKTAIEGWSADWHGCIYIGLPTGQASWHFHDSQAALFAGLPTGDATWDGHDTPEKYRRVEAAFANVQPKGISEYCRATGCAHQAAQCPVWKDGERPPYADAHLPAQAPAPAPAPAPDLHHPDTPNKAEFDALYLSLCDRPITIHETARRCWKAGVAQGQAVQAPAVAPVPPGYKLAPKRPSEDALARARLAYRNATVYDALDVWNRIWEDLPVSDVPVHPMGDA